MEKVSAAASEVQLAFYHLVRLPCLLPTRRPTWATRGGMKKGVHAARVKAGTEPAAEHAQ